MTIVPGSRRSFGLLGLVFLLLACEVGIRGHPETESSRIEGAGSPSDLIGAWVEMWNSYDLDQVPALFLTDDRVTYFSSEYEGVIRGVEALMEHHRSFGFVPGGENKGTRLWVEGLSVDLFGASAVSTGIWYFQREGAEGSDGLTEPQRGPVTFVCILEGGRWRFAHMNFGNYPGSTGN